MSDNDRLHGWLRQNDGSHLPLNHNTARATCASDESGLFGDRDIYRITADIIQHQQNRLSDCPVLKLCIRLCHLVGSR